MGDRARHPQPARARLRGLGIRFARQGAPKPYSDLDLAIIRHTPLPLEVRAALAEDFSMSDLPWKVDVVDWMTTGEPFRKIIEEGKVLLRCPREQCHPGGRPGG